ncbi:hypothetical protein BOTBODRAFT_177419 [Botryobasidium botryosum FD-172 SS1]|uniref:Uncharacterized protein n=1 Tax=Botryobasidium botryosum (strain FD-172 SS1) TaxID=930990 RepID=A0A067M775_BOTB1|nr:hypothetical protein BOTBODRAFT_177419 [Botryobasidium botryosum FD-172 SS1]
MHHRSDDVYNLSAQTVNVTLTPLEQKIRASSPGRRSSVKDDTSRAILSMWQLSAGGQSPLEDVPSRAEATLNALVAFFIPNPSNEGCDAVIAVVDALLTRGFHRTRRIDLAA